MRRGSRTLVAVLAALVVLGSSGCGGGGETTDRSAGPEPQATKQGSGQKSAANQPGAKEQESAKKQSGSAEGNSGATAPRPAAPAPTPSGSLPNEGTKRVAPGVPTAKGGDNSIQEYGAEGAGEDRVEAARTLQAYLDARAAHQWAQACTYLSASIKVGLEQFGGQPQGKDSKSPGCAEAIRALTAGVPASALRSAAEIRVLSMRVKGRQAFLIYRNGEATPSAIPMADEGGVWKVAALDGSPLILGAGSLY